MSRQIPPGWRKKLSRFKHGKPFYTPSEEVPPWFAKRLQGRHWDYKPAGPGGDLGREGGHWTPPGHRAIPRAPQDEHGKHFARRNTSPSQGTATLSSTSTRRPKMNPQKIAGPFSGGARYAGKTGGRPYPVKQGRRRPPKRGRLAPQPMGKRRYLKV